MSEENIESQKEGGLVPYRDQQFETELTEEIKTIQELRKIVDLVRAFLKVIEEGEIKDKSEISSALRQLADNIDSGKFSPGSDALIEHSYND